MYLIKSRKDFREILEELRERAFTRSQQAKNRTDREFELGVRFGISEALAVLDDWDRHLPEQTEEKEGGQQLSS